MTSDRFHFNLSHLPEENPIVVFNLFNPVKLQLLCFRRIDCVILLRNCILVNMSASELFKTKLVFS